MEKIFLDNKLNWYKGNLHSHTTASDGHLAPAESAEMYRENGYSFMCLSEHDLYTDRRKELDRDDFIILPGVEASATMISNEAFERLAGRSFAEIAGDKEMSLLLQKGILKTHHIHGILGNDVMQQNAKAHFEHGDRLKIPVYGEDWDGLAAAQKLSDSLKTYGMFTTYNHPMWSRVDMEDIIGLSGIWAMEIYNYNTVNECGEGFAGPIYDLCLKKGMKLNCFASDDNHNNGRFHDSCGGYVVVNADELSHEKIVNSLMDGRYYSSNMGPSIYRYEICDNLVVLETEKCDHINVISGGHIGLSRTIKDQTGKGLSYLEYALSGDETYVRFECVFANGCTSWTNPINVQLPNV